MNDPIPTTAELKAAVSRTQGEYQRRRESYRLRRSLLFEEFEQVEGLRHRRDAAHRAYRERVEKGEPERLFDPAVMHHVR